MSLQWYALDSEQTKQLLREGQVHFSTADDSLETGIALDEGRWVAQQVNDASVGFEQVHLDQDSSINLRTKLARGFVAIRAISLTATFMPGLAVLLWIWTQGQAMNVPVALGALLGVMFLQIAVNLLNDVEDYLKLIDLPGSLGGSGVIQQGWFTANEMQKAALLAMGLGCLLGLPALFAEPTLILMCGVAAVVGVIGYSGKPLRLKYRALGDVAVWLLCGPVLAIGISAAATGLIIEGVVLIGLFFGFAATAILNANNLNDIRTDRARGSITLAGSLGFDLARHWQSLYYICVFISLFALIINYQSHWLIALPMVALIPSFYSI